MGSKLFFYLFKKKLVYLLVSLLILTVTVQIVDLIELTRNFGKEAAMLAGLDHAKGRCDAVVLIDSDLHFGPYMIDGKKSDFHRNFRKSQILDP